MVADCSPPKTYSFWEELQLAALRRMVKAITHSLHITTNLGWQTFPLLSEEVLCQLERRKLWQTDTSICFGCSVPESSGNLEEVGEDDTLVGDNGEP